MAQLNQGELEKRKFMSVNKSRIRANVLSIGNAGPVCDAGRRT